jgi:hypothetical protein
MPVVPAWSDGKDAVAEQKGMQVVNVKPTAAPRHRRTRSAPGHDLVHRRLSPIKEEDSAALVIQDYLDNATATKRFYQLVCDNEVVDLEQYLNQQSLETIKTLRASLYGVDASPILHCAIRSPDCQKDTKNAMVTFLIDKVGVAICMRDNKERTPLHYAARHGYTGAAALLIKAINEQKASQISKDNQISYVDAQDKDGKTPLHFAVAGGYNDIVALLVNEGGACVDVQDNEGKTPLILAAAGGGIKIAKLLIDHDANIALGDNVGDTPLHVAARNKEEALIAYLVVRREPVYAKNTRNETPFDIAAYNNMSKPILQLLRPPCCSGCCCPRCSGGCCTIM